MNPALAFLIAARRSEIQSLEQLSTPMKLEVRLINP